jgi:hypothetical protein
VADAEAWAVAPFTVWCETLDKGRHEATVAGWVRGLFALDFRGVPSDDGEPSWSSAGWVITHVPTGYSVFGVQAPLEQVKAVVDHMLTLGDWNFADPEGAAALRPAMVVLKRSLGTRCVAAGYFIGPWSSFGITDGSILDGVEHRAVPA